MVTRAHTTISLEQIDDNLRAFGGRVRVRLPDTPIEFEVNYVGVEVIYGDARYIMYQHRDVAYDRIQFRLTVDGRWDCQVTQEGFGRQTHFEVIDKAGDPYHEHNDMIRAQWANPLITDYMRGTSTLNKRKKVLLLCL